MSVSRFPQDVTDAETAFGFAVSSTDQGPRVAADLGGGLRAVKALAADGTCEYIVCDAQLEPLYFAAKTLPELEQRFRRARA